MSMGVIHLELMADQLIAEISALKKLLFFPVTEHNA